MSHPAGTTQRSAILVLGSHRSGTSLVTRILNLLGFALGRELLGEHECNVTGLWENSALVAWNEAYLAGRGSAWFDCRMLHVRRDPAAFEAAVESLVAVLREQFGDAARIAIKDPRICRLVPLYAEALRRLGFATRALVQYRQPLKTALSLYRRDGIPLAVGMRLWLSHTLQSLADTRGWDRLFVGYADLLQAPADNIRRIAAWLARAEAESLAANMAPIIEYVDPLLETVSGTKVDDVLLEDGVAALVDEVYTGLGQAGGAAHDIDFSRFGSWLEQGRGLSAVSSWQDFPVVAVFHSGVDDRPEQVRYLGEQVAGLAGLLVIRDGEDSAAEGGAWGKLALIPGSGLVLNRTVRGEGQSLVRGIGFCRGHAVLLCRRRGAALVAGLLQRLEGSGTEEPRLFLDAGMSAGTGPDLAHLDPEACVALFIPAALAAAIDPWLCINAEGDALARLIAMLARSPEAEQVIHTVHISCK